MNGGGASDEFFALTAGSNMPALVANSSLPVSYSRARGRLERYA
jgi:hypothetical protein